VTFERQEKAEATAKDDAGQALNATAELADITLNNSGSIDELNKNLDELFIILNRT
jgi:dephospho-CoA kinase